MPRIIQLLTIIVPMVMAFDLNTNLQIGSAQEWQQYANLEQAGWSADKLNKSREFATRIGSSAILIVDQGHVVAWGNINQPYKTASVRKSIYDATIGATHFQKTFDVTATLKQLGIDDLVPLSEQEKLATFEHLITARSGVYHPAAYETQSNANRRPKRGSATPGTQWYYNNWDFNVVCVGFEQLSGIPIKKAFEDRIAKPLGMEDFESSHVFVYLEPRMSQHPAITFRLSARDLARLGKLYLQDGVWENNQIVSADWVKESTRPHTTFEKGHYRGEGIGYGRLWWVFPAKQKTDSVYEAQHRIAALGAGGQMMVLFPSLDLLIVHLADTDNGRGVSDQNREKLLNMILSSRDGKPASNSKLGQVKTEKLSGSVANPMRNDLVAIPKEKLDALEGRYMVTKDAGVLLYQYNDRLFVQPLGMPYKNDAELFLSPDGSLFSPVVNVVFEPMGRNDKRVDAIRVTIGGQSQTARRTNQ